MGQTDGSHFDQIPGLASQRLMAEGYGFGAEGDWKSAALYRTVWVMNQGLPNGCSFLEDLYVELQWLKEVLSCRHTCWKVCPLIAAQKATSGSTFPGYRCPVRARLPVWYSLQRRGTGCTATVVDMGNRFRLIVNDVECIEPKTAA